MDELSAKKKVAILGSSGGNLFYLGGKEPEKLLEELLLQIEAAGMVGRYSSLQQKPLWTP
jgi:hypothetical protein